MPSLIRLEKAEGTPLIRLTLDPICGQSAIAQQVAHYSMLPPKSSGAKISNTETSKLSEVAANTRDSRWELISADAQAMRRNRIAMRDHHALWSASRAGGIDDVGGVLGDKGPGALPVRGVSLWMLSQSAAVSG